MDEVGNQRLWRPEGLSRTLSRASEARSGIRQRKSSYRASTGRLRHQIPLPNVNAQAQVFAGALETAQNRQQDAYQTIWEQLQTQLAKEISDWKAEQQIHDGLYQERITGLELEVSKLRTELTDAKRTIQQLESQRQNTPVISTQGPRAGQHNQNQVPKARGILNQIPRQKPTFADLAALLSTKPEGQEWQEITQKKKKQKYQQARAALASGRPDPTKLQPAKNCPKEARKLLFRREGSKDAPRSEKEDIILAINRAVADKGLLTFIRAVDAGYINTGAITILLDKGTLSSMLLPSYKDLLVTAARQADPFVISIEQPEQWYRVKVYGVPIRRYLSCGLSLARAKIELGTEYHLKRNPTWLRSLKDLQSSDRKGSTIVLTVGSLDEARRLLVNGIRFGGSRYRTEQYWETGADTVCRRCCQLGYRSFKACGGRPPCYFICAGPHEGTEHVCRVVDCPAKPGTACKHIPARCGACSGPHPATASNCPAKRAVRKELKKRNSEQKELPQQDKSPRQTSNQEPATPSSPSFTVINRDRKRAGLRSTSAPSSPRTQCNLAPESMATSI
ncbi:uncharacterized protein KD926_004259 [Aspergillus affinis]|uniref:uncharacterized protein n=1 Tax=Aspergillus affinis TaxID=1070780 RepID=UPI0022FDC80A|nr:uncharacterized protein KD926_004259 [Aspergillus affinis]KAI9035227.1 hypothetical protein KD926_004259 [Aspergillus affinis]